LNEFPQSLNKSKPSEKRKSAKIIQEISFLDIWNQLGPKYMKTGNPTARTCRSFRLISSFSTLLILSYAEDRN